MTSAAASGERRARPIWAHLALFALSIVIPLWCLLGVVAWTTLQAGRREAQQQTILVARNLALELDRTLAGLGGMLQALATSPALADGDLRRFHDQALRIVPEGGAIVMRDRTGQHLVNTLFPFGTPLPVTSSPVVLAADACVFRTRAACVSDLYTGTTDPQPYVLLDAPVMQGGEVAFALNVAVRRSSWPPCSRETGCPRAGASRSSTARTTSSRAGPTMTATSAARPMRRCGPAPRRRKARSAA